MSERPSFQFYHGAWRSNAKLRRCTHAERGIWIDTMCLLADSDEFGILRWPLGELARAVGCKVKELLSLHAKTILKGADCGQTVNPFVFVPRHAGKEGQPVILIPEQQGPVWYSSRMVRDAYIASIRGKGTRFGEAPEKPPDDTPTRRIGDGLSSSSSSSSKPKGAGAAGAAAFVVPDWIPPDAWAGFDAMRKKIRKPMTERAKKMIVNELARLRDQGEDVAKVLEQSERLDWQDVYPVRKNGAGGNGNGSSGEPARPVCVGACHKPIVGGRTMTTAGWMCDACYERRGGLASP